MKIDSLPYKTFQKLKKKYTVKTIVLDEATMAMQGLHLAFKNHRELVLHKFAQIGIEVYRFSHDYDSLDTAHPRLGLVFMVNDSTIVPGIEVHALMEHNARSMNTHETRNKI